MSSPRGQGYDSELLRTLACAALDGTADEAQLEELTNLLEGDIAAQDEYLAFVDQHAILATSLSGTLTTGDDAAADITLPGVPTGNEGIQSPEAEPQTLAALQSGRRLWFQVAGLAALAASILVAIVSFPSGEGPDESGVALVDDSFATIAQVTDVRWGASSFSEGDRFGVATLTLKSGFARIEFDSGVEVTLEGPAEYRILAPDKTELRTGLLAATVSEGAEGFTVSTPTAEVVDLGTSFGVDLREDGFSNVTVFDGEVEVARLNDRIGASEKQLLVEGESVRIGASEGIEKIGFDSDSYERLWPVASGITGSTKTIRCLPPWPRRIRFVQSDDVIFLAREARNVALRETLTLNISKPGDYISESELTPGELPVGERVRSYILHYSPASVLGPRRVKRIVGSITFDRPIRGIILAHEDLLASSWRFSRRNAGEGDFRREVNLNGDPLGDRITLSEDQRTLTLELVSPGRSSDLLRVIVDGEESYRPFAFRPRN